MGRLTRHPGDDVLRDLLEPLLAESNILKSAMEIYHLADPDSPQRTYDFLHRALAMHVQKRRQQKNRDDMISHLSQSLKGKAKDDGPSPIAHRAGTDNACQGKVGG